MDDMRLRRRRRRHAERARQPEAKLAILDFDFRQPRIVKHLRQIAHEIGIDAARGLAPLRLAQLRHARRRSLYDCSRPFLAHAL